jgi:hypothetical protein
MKNETKSTEKTNSVETQEGFQQIEPAELEEADLLGVAAGAAATGTAGDTSFRCNCPP